MIELGHIAAAPFATMLLADLGADVVKVESPEGDGMRGWPPFVDAGGERQSLNFVSLNRNKMGVRADLKDPAQQSAVFELCQSADVVVENYRAGVLERLGLGYAAVTAGHRGLVYCSITGFGLTSPYRDRGAFDVIIQAMSGLMSVTGEPERPPSKCGVPVGDFVAGLYAAFTVASLLPQVRESGHSVHVDCSMLDCLLAVSALQTSEYWGTGRTPVRLGSAHPRNAPYQVFATADRPLAIAAGTERLWELLCEVLNAEHLTHDPRFTDQLARAKRQAELADSIESILRRRSCTEWVAVLESAGIPCGPVNTYAEILEDPHVLFGGLLDEVELAGGWRTPAFLYPVRMSGRSPRTTSPPPPTGGNRLLDVLESWRN
ncbi:MAG: CaiB/BaiF CoA transferase family protein [Acidimicrobiia bacterium]